MIVLPLSRWILTRAPCSSSTISSLPTLSPSRKVARFSLRWWQNSSAISWSTNGSSRWRLSIRVTRTPSAAKMLGYSQPIEIKNVVAGEDPFPIERNVRIAGGFRAGGDDDLPGPEGARAGAVDILKANRVRRDERCCRRDNFHIIAHQLMAGHIELVLDHPVGAE